MINFTVRVEVKSWREGLPLPSESSEADVESAFAKKNYAYVEAALHHAADRYENMNAENKKRWREICVAFCRTDPLTKRIGPRILEALNSVDSILQSSLAKNIRRASAEEVRRVIRLLQICELLKRDKEGSSHRLRTLVRIIDSSRSAEAASPRLMNRT
jgi:hypothetical protein